MEYANIARAFLEKGWEIRYRGGNAICSTPSDLDVIVADAPSAGGGTRPSLSIAAWPAPNPDGAGRPVLDLYDAERDAEVRIDHVPTPEEAAGLIERHEAGGFLLDGGEKA